MCYFTREVSRGISRGQRLRKLSTAISLSKIRLLSTTKSFLYVIMSRCVWCYVVIYFRIVFHPSSWHKRGHCFGGSTHLPQVLHFLHLHFHSKPKSTGFLHCFLVKTAGSKWNVCLCSNLISHLIKSCKWHFVVLCTNGSPTAR